MNEWCTGCKEYDTEKHCCPRFNQVIRRTMNERINALLDERINDLLDEIKEEITEEETECPSSADYLVGMKHGLKYACKIIDRHRAEK